MKTEEFDDAIKRKLASINPAIDEKEIDRVHTYTVNNRSPFSFLKTNRAFWALMAAGMIGTALLTWKLTSMDSHVKNTASIIPVISAPAQNGINQSLKVVTKTDTVYITKYIDKSAGLNEKPKSGINKNIAKKTYKFAQNDVSETGSTDKRLSIKDVSTGNMNPGLTDETKLSSSSDIKPANNETIAKSQPQIITHSAAIAKSKPENITQSAAIAKSNDTVTAKKEAAKNASKKLPVHNYSDEHKNPTAKKPLDLGFMTGIGGELANTQMGGGIYTRLLLHRFSLNAGIKWMSVNYQQYGSDIAYDQAHPGHNFKWYYCPNLPASYGVSNIQLTYSLWQIPLALEYDLPLANNWSFSVSAGTDLDISCINNVKYTTSEGGGDNSQASQVNNYPSVVFNNIVVSMGLIKQWGHLNLQVSPFVSQQVEKAWYKGPDKTFYGGDIKLFYRF